MKKNSVVSLTHLIPAQLNPVNLVDETILLNIGEVADRFSLSRSTIYRMIKQGIFPRPRRLGAKTVRWSQKDLVEWLRSKNQGE